MCNYLGFEFGGGYLDSVCIDGRLYDADHCDDQGNLYEPLENIPCPMCDPKGAVRYYMAGWEGRGKSMRECRKAARALVLDIRRNRGVDSLTNTAA